MLDSFKSGQLNDTILFAKWSGKMDVIAFCYINNENKIELRRMVDWVKVNTFSLPSAAQNVCFSPDGKSIIVSTISREILQYDIETAKLISSTILPKDITCIAYNQSNGINILAVGNSDNTVAVFSELQFALCTFPLDGQNAEEISISEGKIYVLLEDLKTVMSFSLPFIEEESELIQKTSQSILSFWINCQKVDNSIAEFDEIWKSLWTEVKEITQYMPNIVRSFLLGDKLETPFSENHIQHLQKQVKNSLEQLTDVIASNIVPAFVKIDKASEDIIKAIKTAPKDLGIQIDYNSSTEQIQQCLARLEMITMISNCFDALFEFLSTDAMHTYTVLDNLGVSTGIFSEFLTKYCKFFDIQEIMPIEVTCSINSVPTYEAKKEVTSEIKGNFSIMNYSYVSSLEGNKATILNLDTQEANEYSTKDEITLAYPFQDGSVGIFSHEGSKTLFTMFGGDEGEEEEEAGEPTPREVLLTDVTSIIVSNRKIAFVHSSTSFFTIVDLVPVDDEDEEEEEEN